MRGVFFDFEATDKEPKTARITQVALSLFDLEKKKELCFDSYLVCPTGDYSINDYAAKITGITREQLNEFGVSTILALTRFNVFVDRADFIIGHNIRSYDLPLYQAECDRCGLDPKLSHLKTIDTRFDIPWNEGIETRKLSYLGAEYGVVNPSAHSARHDVDIMAKLFMMFDLKEIIARAASPELWIRAHVDFANKDLAREKRFMWDGSNKWWVKVYKECDFVKEEFKFKTSILSGYKGP